MTLFCLFTDVSPAATLSGHWWPLSRRWSCPACPDERNVGARWTPRSPRCGKSWKPSAACHRSAVTWYLAARSNLSCSNTLWSETTERERGRGQEVAERWMGSVSAQAAQTTSAQSGSRVSFMQVSGKMLCVWVCEAHAGESRRCVKHACSCDGQPERHRWNSKLGNTVNKTDMCSISTM